MKSALIALYVGLALLVVLVGLVAFKSHLNAERPAVSLPNTP